MLHLFYTCMLCIHMIIYYIPTSCSYQAILSVAVEALSLSWRTYPLGSSLTRAADKAIGVGHATDAAASASAE